jgi:protoporphyrinogen oxidase
MVVLGGGLAGLTVVKRLVDLGCAGVTVVEKDNCIGGAARTVQIGPYRFDLGGHRIYTKKGGVQKFIEDLLGDELIWVDRVSRIHINGRMASYPLAPFDALKALGPIKSAKVILHYLKGKIVPAPSGNTFEHWAVERFGWGLYDIYFRPYSEKVWGIPCDQLSADFAEQRIKGLSFREAIKNALFGSKETPASLITRFCYPRLGFGRIVEKMAEVIKAPHRLLLQTQPVAIHHQGGKIQSLTVQRGDSQETLKTSQLISTIPLDALVECLRPAAPGEVVEAVRKLRYRGLITVFLAMRRPKVTSDTWIYFPDPGVPFGRMHEPPNWSRPDDELSARTVSELLRLGFIRPEEVEVSAVIRLQHAYPLYVLGYDKPLAAVVQYLRQFGNLHLSGRNGLFLYTSSDHYMDMSLKIAENLMGASHEVTGIGKESGYAEE